MTNAVYLKARNIVYVLLIILTTECVIGGGGRWLEFGSLSIRMVLFIAAFILSLPFVINKFKDIMKNKIIIAILLFCVFLCYSLFNGYYKNNNHSFIIADLTSVLFLAIIPAYMAILDDEKKISKLLNVASFASVILACLVIFIHFTWRFMSQEARISLNNIINEMSLGGLFSFGNGITRIYFKSSVCFILPFLYNLNRIIHYQKSESKKKYIVYCLFMIISFIAIVLSYTRSIWFGAFAATVLFIIFNFKKYKQIFKSVAVVMVGFLIFIGTSWIYYGYEGIISNVVDRVTLNSDYNDYISSNNPAEDIDQQRLIEMESEKVRGDRIENVIQSIRNHPILGNGLGLSDSVKGEGKIEYTYLDILSKMGVIGLLLFLIVLLMPYFYAFKKRKVNNDSGMLIMMCVMACILVASIYNPFITSPIGLSLYAVFVSSINSKGALKSNFILGETL